jgi:hypothetical protein
MPRGYILRRGGTWLTIKTLADHIHCYLTVSVALLFMAFMANKFRITESSSGKVQESRNTKRWSSSNCFLCYSCIGRIALSSSRLTRLHYMFAAIYLLPIRSLKSMYNTITFYVTFWWFKFMKNPYQLSVKSTVRPYFRCEGVMLRGLIEDMRLILRDLIVEVRVMLGDLIVDVRQISCYLIVDVKMNES